MRRLSFALIAATLCLGSSLRSWADEPPPPMLDLTWQAPPDCSTAQLVTQEVAVLLGSPRSGPTQGASNPGERLSALAVVTTSERGWQVVLTTALRGVQGRRRLEARSCEALAHATALVLALTIDSTRAAAVAEPEGDAGVTERGRSASADVSPSIAPARPAEGEGEGHAVQPVVRSTFSLGVGLAASIGALPSLAFGPEISGGWRKGGFRLDLALAYFPQSRALRDATRGGDFHLARGALRGCKMWGEHGFELGPCLAVSAGAIKGDGIGIRFPGSGVAPWLAVSGGAAAAQRVGKTPLWVLLTVEAELPIVRDQFVVDGLGVVHHPLAVGGRASFGGEVRF